MAYINTFGEYKRPRPYDGYGDEDEEEDFSSPRPSGGRRDMVEYDSDGEEAEKPVQKLDSVPGFKRSSRIDEATQRADEAARRSSDYAGKSAAELNAVAKPSLGRRIAGGALAGFLGFASARPMSEDTAAAIDRGVVRPGYYDKLREVKAGQEALDRESDAANRNLKATYESEESQAKIAAQNAAQQSYEARAKGWEARAAEAARKANVAEPPPTNAAQLPEWYNRNKARLQTQYPTLNDYLKDVLAVANAMEPPKPPQPTRPTPPPKTEQERLVRILDDEKATPEQKQAAQARLNVLNAKQPRAGRQRGPLDDFRVLDAKAKREAEAIAGRIIKAEQGGDDVAEKKAIAELPDEMVGPVKASLQRMRGRQSGKGDAKARIAELIGLKKPAATPPAKAPTTAAAAAPQKKPLSEMTTEELLAEMAR